MNIVDLAKKIQNSLLKGKQPHFTIEFSEQIRILESFQEPKNLIERSYFQYLCQMKQLPIVLKFIQNIVSIFWLPLFFLVNYKKSLQKEVSKNSIAIFITGLKDFSYIPKSLANEFNQIVHSDYSSPVIITSYDKDIIKEIFIKYWYKPYFVLKCVMKIGLYSQQINTNNPKAILTFGEFSFTSSILTYYCNEFGIEHINIMHGEKLFNIRDSFVKFNRYYVWDSHYVELMKSLRADSNQFLIEIPPILSMALEAIDKPHYELTYFLANESKDELMYIKNNLQQIIFPNKKICIRYHPRYGDLELIRNIFCEFTIEDPRHVPLSKSFSNTKRICSLYSTVLFQANLAGKDIVIDDISNNGKYVKLKELNYVMIDKKHLKLSQII